MLNVEFSEKQLGDFEFDFKRRVNLKNFLVSEGAVFTDSNRTQCPLCGNQEVEVGLSKKKGFWMWRCWHCKKAGTITEWVMKKYGLSREDAIIYIKEKTEAMNEAEEKTENEDPENRTGNDLDEIKRYPLPDYLKAYYGIELDSKGRGSCPFHPPDDNSSFNVWCNGRGIWFWKCFHDGDYSGTSIDFVMRIEGVSLEEAVRRLKERLNINSRPEGSGSRIEREHIYKDAEGNEVFKKIKYENRSWAFFHKTNEGWEKGKGDHEPIPYNLDKFKDHKGGGAIVCEGEKDAETVINLGIGLLGTSAPYGKDSWPKELTKYFKDFSTISFLYDVGNEESARKHAEKLKTTAYPDKKFSLMKVPMEKREADITDYLEQEENEGRDKVMSFLDLQEKAEEIEVVLEIESIEDSLSSEIEEPEVKPEIKKEEPQVQIEIKPEVKPDCEKKESRIKTVEEDFKANLINLGDVKPEKVEWLWSNRIPHGKLSLISGDPGEAKSFFTIFLASCVTTGRPYPDGEKPIKGSVIILTAEDGLADTVRPRADANEADVSKITILESVKDEHGDRFFDVDRDIPILEKAIKRAEDLVLIIIDPITAYLGTKVDSHKNPDVRRALSPLSKLAEKYKVAIIVVSHLNKDETKKAVYRTSGSLAFVATARSAWVITKDSNDQGRRLFLPVKTNLSIDPSGLAFRIEDMKLIFEKEPCKERVEEALSKSKTEEHSQVDLAEDFLKTLLAGGAVLATEVFRQAEENRYSVSSIRRAQKRLGIKPHKEGQWYWKLPEKG